LIKNALKFVTELFFEKRDREIAEFVKIVLPAVLIKTVYEKNFIVVEAKKAMNTSLANCHFPETMQVTIEGCESKNGVLAELSIGYLSELVNHMEAGFYLECSPTV
jgi:hypothetical protein